MMFKDFAQLLFPIIGAGNSTHAFTRSIFEAMVAEAGQEILDGYSNETFKAYYNGNTEITRLAKKIFPYIEPFEFSEYIKEFSDSAVQNLCNSFKKYIPGINPYNAADELSAQFSLIIKEAASMKRNAAKKSQPSNGSNCDNPTNNETEFLLSRTVHNNTSSGTDKEDNKKNIIHQQTNVIQHGENNYNVTNNGIINLNF